MLGEIIGIALSVPFRFPLFFPILLLVAILASALLSIVVSLGLLVIMQAFSPDSPDSFPWATYDSLTNGISLIIFLWLLLGFMIQVTIVLTDIEKDRARDRIAILCELLLSMVVVFAVLHYYVAVFTEDAYEGIEVIKAHSVDDFGNAVSNILSIPTLSSAVDFLYFSVVTFSTVGFGDMHPSGTVAKLLTVTQIIFGFSVVIVALGRAFGEKSSSSS